jgi:signal transduction histidine kinase
MPSSHRPSLASAPFRAPLLVLFALALLLAIFWSINEYKTYQQSIRNTEQNYKALYRERVREELGNIENFIDQQRSQAIVNVEDELRQKVQSAYTIASHIYQMYKERLNSSKLRSMVAETLRPIRWNNGQGYYFAGRVNANTIDLFADDPLLEGQNPTQLREQRYASIFNDLTHIIREKGAGIYRKPEKKDPPFPGMTFVKYFKPFDWYIGASTFQEITKRVLQENILTTVQNMQFSEDGHVLCFDASGTILSHPNSVLIGSSITNLVNERGENYGEMVLETGLRNKSGATLLYSFTDPLSGKELQRLSFIRYYPDWDWIFLVDISMTAMEKAISREKEIATTTSVQNGFIFLTLLITAVLFLTSMAYYHSVKTKQGIKLFTTFFRKAAHTRVKISNTDSTFAEFEKVIGKDPEFVDLMKEKSKYDARLKKGRRTSSAIRFSMAFYLRQKKADTLKEEIANNSD